MDGEEVTHTKGWSEALWQDQQIWPLVWEWWTKRWNLSWILKCMWLIIRVGCSVIHTNVCVCVHVFSASASSCPTANKLSAAIMEEGPHCVTDKSGVCHWLEITVIYEGLSLWQQANMHFGGLSVSGPPLCTCKKKLAGMCSIFTFTLASRLDVLLHWKLRGVEKWHHELRDRRDCIYNGPRTQSVRELQFWELLWRNLVLECSRGIYLLISHMIS